MISRNILYWIAPVSRYPCEVQECQYTLQPKRRRLKSPRVINSCRAQNTYCAPGPSLSVTRLSPCRRQRITVAAFLVHIGYTQAFPELRSNRELFTSTQPQHRLSHKHKLKMERRNTFFIVRKEFQSARCTRFIPERRWINRGRRERTLKPFAESHSRIRVSSVIRCPEDRPESA